MQIQPLSAVRHILVYVQKKTIQLYPQLLNISVCHVWMENSAVGGMSRANYTLKHAMAMKGVMVPPGIVLQKVEPVTFHQMA